MDKHRLSPRQFGPIAIIGIGSMFAQAKNTRQFWQNIVSGKDLIRDVPPCHWLIDDYFDPDPKAVDKIHCKRGSFLEYVDFDPMEYGIPPKTIPVIDTSQLLALLVAKETLSDASNHNISQLNLNRTSVILGTAALEALQYTASRLQRPIWNKALREHGLPEGDVQKIADAIAASYTPWEENTFPGLLTNVVAGRIANHFNLGGSNYTTDAACAGSLASLMASINELHLGQADLAITGGVDTLNEIGMYMCFSKTHAMSQAQDCRPFSDKADGTVLGEGLCLFMLKRLSDAERDNDHIYAVIKGLGSSSDGKAKSIYAPLAKGQRRAVSRAYEAAGYDISTVELVEAHGTGTSVGDAVEADGLKNAFGNTKLQSCALGSIKSQIGHTKSTAGAAGLFKAVMALHHKVLPPTIKVDKPNPALQLEQSPFYLNTQTRPWIRANDHPRRAQVNAFGFGGTNFTVAVEEYTDNKRKAGRLNVFPSQLVILTAKDSVGLIHVCQSLRDDIQGDDYLLYVSRHSQENYNKKDPVRLAIIAADEEDLKSHLQQAIQRIQAKPEENFSLPNRMHYGVNVTPGKIAFLFPGQGSQVVNMSGHLAMAFEEAIAPWDAVAHEKVRDEVAIQNVVFPLPVFSDAEREAQQQKLQATEWAQPGLAIANSAYLSVLNTLAVKPDCVAGHSFGELNALCAAGVYDAQTLFQLACERGKVMRDAAQQKGAMLAVMASAAEVEKQLKIADIQLTIANYNSPKQVVLSGSNEHIEHAQQHLQQQMACRRLNVATAFHSPIVQSACQPFQAFVEKCKFNKPRVTVYANLTAQPYPQQTKQIKEQLVQQLVNPVKFQQQIEAMYAEGVRTFIEVGPRGVLTKLVQQTLASHEHHAIALDQPGEHGVSALWNALGSLVCAGIQPDFSALWKTYRRIDKPVTNSGKFTLKLNGTNYGRPYPPRGGSAALPKPNLQASSEQSIQQENEEIDMSQQNNPQLIQMYQMLQQQLVGTQNTHQKSMAQSHIVSAMAQGHMVFLKSMSALARQVGAGDGDTSGMSEAEFAAAMAAVNIPSVQQQPSVGSVQQPGPAPTTMPPQPSMGPLPITMPPQFSVAPAPVAAPPSMPQVSRPSAPMMTTPVASPPAAEPPKMNGQSAPVPHTSNGHNEPATQSVGTPSDFEKLMLDIVVEKTGYPADMLNMDMGLENDLGIDSIKRVEIFSEIQNKVPNLPEVDMTKMAELKTLGDISGYIQELMTGQQQAPVVMQQPQVDEKKKLSSVEA